MTGMRACALHMLFAVASVWTVWTQESAALADLLTFLAHEAALDLNPDVIAEGVRLNGFDVKSVIEWVQSADLIQTDLLCVLQLTAMRATFSFRSAALASWVAALPECVRARVFAEAVVEEYLSRLEQTRLLRGRLDLVLKERRLRALNGERGIAGPVEQEIIQVLDLMRSQREEMPAARQSDAGSMERNERRSARIFPRPVRCRTPTFTVHHATNLKSVQNGTARPAKTGGSTREITEITGWSRETIAADLRVGRNLPKSGRNLPARPSKTANAVRPFINGSVPSR